MRKQRRHWHWKTKRGSKNSARYPRTRPLLESLEDRRLLASVTFEQGVGGYTGAADTFVLASNPNADNSAANVINVDGATGGGEAQGLLRFDDILGGNPDQIPSASQIVVATLELQVLGGGASIQLQRMLATWSDTDSWNDLNNGIQADDVEAASNSDASTGPVLPGLLSIDVTSSLQAWADSPASNHGWAFLPTGTNGVDIESVDSGTPPRLVVEFVTSGGSPTAADDTFEVDEDDSLHVPSDGVLGNDSDPDADPLSALLVTGPGNARSFELVADGSFSYVPNADFNGNDSFTYRASDGSSVSGVATVTVFVAPVEDDPVANDNDYAISLNATLGGNVITDDTGAGVDGDPDGDPLTANPTPVSGPANGTLTIASDGGFTYTPDTDFEGSDSFVYEINDGNGGTGTATVNITVSPQPVEPQYTIKHTPYIQLGDAPLTGFPGSGLDRIDILWQTVPAGSGTQDSFSVEYRLANPSQPWAPAVPISELDTGVEDRINHSATIVGLTHDTRYEYRVRHLRGGAVVDTYQATFRTRLAAGDDSPFNFVAYGDSADGATDFLDVQNQINLIDPAFTLLLGDAAYSDGTHEDFDARFDPTLAPEATLYNAGHVDYLGFGNHDVRVAEGKAAEDNYSSPIPVAGVNAPFAPPATERPEHNYSFDFGNVHFVTFDSNSLGDDPRLNSLLDWAVADLNASSAQWKIVFVHHPLAGVPDKSQHPGQDYYQQVVSRLGEAGVDLYLTGHSHTYSWTYPLTGEVAGEATFVLDTDKDYQKGDGLVQVVSGVGGASLRPGDYGQFPFVAAGYTTDTTPSLEFGFSRVDVTPTQLTVSYVSANDGAVIDAFTITDGPDTTPPTASVAVPLDNGPSDFDPANDLVVVNSPQPSLQIELTDIGDGIDDATAVSQTLAVTKDGLQLNQPADYEFTYSAADDLITLTPVAGTFEAGLYSITLNGGPVEIADLAGNVMSPSALTVDIDTTITGARTASFQAGRGGYAGTVDTYLKGATPDTDKSTAPVLNVDGASGGAPVQALLRFGDIFGSGVGQVPIGSQIALATLELQITGGGSGLELHRMLRTWSDTDTWNTLDNGIQDDDVEAASAFDARASEVVVGLLSIDVTSSLQAWVGDAANNHGWAVLPTGNNGIDFESAEGSTPPRLIVDYVAATPPLAPQMTGPQGATNDPTPTFTWNQVAGATHYDLWVRNLTTGEDEVIREQQLTGSSFTPSIGLPESDYRAWVRGLNSAGLASPWSHYIDFAIGQPPATPALSAPQGATTDSTPTFTWTVSADATHHDLWVRNLTTGEDEVIREQQLPGGSYTPTIPLPEANYRAWIRAFNAAGLASAWSGENDFSIGQPPEPPARTAPQGAISDPTPTFSWTASSGATYYDLWVRNLTTGEDEVIREQQLTGTSFTPPVALPNANYRGWIRAINASGVESEWSSQADFAIGQPPAAPILINPQGATADVTPTFSWTTSSGATHYDLWVRNLTTGEDEVIRQRQLTGNSFTPTTPLPEAHYSGWIRAINVDGLASSWSAAIEFSVGQPPPVPTLTAPLGATNDATPTFTWTAVADATHYDLWVRNLTTGEDEVIRQQQLTGTSYTPATPLPGAEYRAWIRAFNASGLASTWSSPLDFEIPAV